MAEGGGPVGQGRRRRRGTGRRGGGRSAGVVVVVGRPLLGLGERRREEDAGVLGGRGGEPALRPPDAAYVPGSRWMWAVGMRKILSITVVTYLAKVSTFALISSAQAMAERKARSSPPELSLQP